MLFSRPHVTIAMPASSSDHLEQIEETLRISLTCTEDIDQQLLSASKRVLLHKIDFKPAEKPHTLQVETLRAKYVALNPSKSLNKRQPSGRENASGIEITPSAKLAIN